MNTRRLGAAVKLFGEKSRTETAHSPLSEIAALKRFKNLMKKNAGKIKFAGHRV